MNKKLPKNDIIFHVEELEERLEMTVVAAESCIDDHIEFVIEGGTETECGTTRTGIRATLRWFF